MRAKLEHRFPISFMTVCLFEPRFTLFLFFGVSAQLKSPPIVKLLSENPRRVWFKFSLQCRRFWWFSSVKPPFWIRWRLRELGRECENVGGGRGGEGKIFLPPPPSPIFLPPSHWLGKLFTSPQLSTVFLIQDGGPNNRWE